MTASEHAAQDAKELDAMADNHDAAAAAAAAGGGEQQEEESSSSSSRSSSRSRRRRRRRSGGMGCICPCPERNEKPPLGSRLDI
jgi:hypothetical protein